MWDSLKKYDKNTLWQLVRFGIVGVINTLITLVVIYVLQELLHVKYTDRQSGGLYSRGHQQFLLEQTVGI